MDKPSFEESLRALAARRLAREGHPAPEHLAAYRAGTLAMEQQARIKDHLAICEDCSRLLQDLAEFERFEPRESIVPVDPKTEASWQRLRARLQEDGGEAEREDATRAAEAVPVLVPRRNARARPLWRNPSIPWALAAGLAVCVAGLGLRTATLQREVERLSALQFDVALVDLYPESMVNTRGEASPAERTGGASVLILHLPVDAPSFPLYEVEVVPGSGQEPVFEPQRGPAQDETLTLQLPREPLAPGSYTVHLFGLTGDQRQLLDRYLFEISPGAS